MDVTQKIRQRLEQTKRTHAWGRMVNLLLPWVVLLAMLGITWHVWTSARQQATQQVQAEFDFAVQEAVRDLEMRMETYKLLLHGVQGLFESSDDVTPEEFRSYVATLDLPKRFPGIDVIGLSRIVTAAQRDALTARMRRNGHRDYAIRPAGDRTLLTAIVYVSPVSADNMLGLDMYADPAHRLAMDRARLENAAILTANVMLEQKSPAGAKPGFVLFLPVHAQRNAEFDRTPPVFGWVFVTVPADDLKAVLTASARNRLALRLYDGIGTTDDKLLASSGVAQHKSMKPSHELQQRRLVNIAGHDWTLDARALPALGSGIQFGNPRIVLIAGIGSSLLLAILTQLLIHGRAHALRIAQEMNSALIKSEYRWKYALEGSGEGVWDWDIASNLVFQGPRLRAILGHEPVEITEHFDALKAQCHPEEREVVSAALAACLQDENPEFSAEARLLCQDGSWKWCVLRGIVVSRDEDGNPLRMIGTLADISERHEREETLRLWSTVFANAHEAVLIANARNEILAVNPSFTEITGYAEQDVVGRPVTDISKGAITAEQTRSMQESLQEADEWVGEITGRRKSGELYTAWLSVSCVRNAAGQPTHYVSIFSDISERKAAETRITYLAHYDMLTDLPNRALFADRLRQALAGARRNQSGVALLFVDLDKFKPVNDTLGHEIGDLLLKEVAYRILDCIRESDTAARIGGDEFVVLLPGVETVADARTVAEKILQSIEDPCDLGGHDVRISASIGIAIYPQHGMSDQEILSNADNAMYHAKHSGGGRVASFDDIPPQPAAADKAPD